jgi:hypothetical protein
MAGTAESSPARRAGYRFPARPVPVWPGRLRITQDVSPGFAAYSGTKRMVLQQEKLLWMLSFVLYQGTTSVGP